mmetsp:Transcript_29510/g.68613  ORF Transcript_29510/g.68613 Transcript_29510/m.68613 type:complete len:259 (+) Transcript_29510:1480-2256(+)
MDQGCRLLPNNLLDVVLQDHDPEALKGELVHLHILFATPTRTVGVRNHRDVDAATVHGTVDRLEGCAQLFWFDLALLSSVLHLGDQVFRADSVQLAPVQVAESLAKHEVVCRGVVKRELPLVKFLFSGSAATLEDCPCSSQAGPSGDLLLRGSGYLWQRHNLPALLVSHGACRRLKPTAQPLELCLESEGLRAVVVTLFDQRCLGESAMIFSLLCKRAAKICNLLGEGVRERDVVVTTRGLDGAEGRHRSVWPRHAPR